MKFRRSFQVKAPQQSVTEFHAQAESLQAITPPVVRMWIHSAPPQLDEGDRMDFTMWLGPVPVRWVAQIEAVTEQSFVDRQVKGPFARWEHRHTFLPVSPNMTEVHDEVEAELSSHWFWKLVGLGMWLGLPVLFAYRAWKTKRLLE